MYFTKFELINIQKHPKLILSLTKGLNIIHGDTGTCKTGVLRGLLWLCGERQRSILRDGELSCSFAATRDDGIKIKRIKKVTRDKKTDKIKSVTINRYEVYYPNKDKPVIYNKVGKTIPIEIAELLGKVELEVDGEKLLLDFTKQKEPYFFLGEKGSFRMKLLNKLTGSEGIDRTIHSYNKDMTRINREKGIYDKDIDNQKEHLKKVSDELSEKMGTLSDTKILLDKITALQERNKKLKTLIDKKEEISCNLQKLNNLIATKKIISDEEISKIKIMNDKNNLLNALMIDYTKNKNCLEESNRKLLTIKVLDEITIKNIHSLQIKTSKLSTLVNKYKELRNVINNTESSLKIKKSQQIDISALVKLQNKVTTIKNNLLELTSHNTAIKTLESQKSSLTSQIEKNQLKIGELIKIGKDTGQCPNCGFQIS